jgi:hypothetical protein
MGKQFSSPAIEQINTAVGSLQTSVGTLNTTVDTLKNTDVANIMTDSKYQMINYDRNLSHGGGTSTIISVSGKGFLKKACARVPSANTMSFKITVDGVVKYHATSATTGFTMGVAYDEGLHTSGASPATKVCGYSSTVTGTAEYPYTTNGEANCTIGKPIYFNTSLLIEYICGSAQTIPIIVNGGYV